MPIYQAQVVLPYFTGLPEDVIVNRWHFFVGAITKAQAADIIATRLSAFYLATYGGPSTQRVNYVDWQLAKVKVFNLDDAIPRVPEVRPLGNFTGGIDVSVIPTEVAMVVSFHAAPDSGVRFQRLYNRIYLGAIGTSWMTGSAVDSYPIFSQSRITSIVTACQQLLQANTLDVAWRQVSNAGGVAVHRAIAGGWIDNSPDTQRRRTVLSTVRNPWAPL